MNMNRAVIPILLTFVHLVALNLLHSKQPIHLIIVAEIRHVGVPDCIKSYKLTSLKHPKYLILGSFFVASFFSFSCSIYSYHRLIF